jgi:hypothetical protein
VRKHRQTARVIALLLTLQGVALAQDPTPQKPPPAPKSEPAAPSKPSGLYIPIRLQFLISKYQGEKKVTSLPYSISLNANGPRVSLRMGARVPYYTTHFAEGKSSSALAYEQVGVNIDSGASTAGMDGGQFRVDITVEGSSIASANQAQSTVSSGAPTAPVFRHFRTSSNLLLKDGQTTQLTTAADPISGEVMRVDVTLTVVK